MPTYDYRCGACGHQFEHFQSISSPTLRKCPKCKKPKLERLIGAGGGLLFKGSGFYITDYRSSSYHDAAKADQGSGNDGGAAASKSEPKSEPKGDAKGDAKGGSKGDSSPAPKPESAAATQKPASSSPAPRSKKSRSS
jgi:putative FmdB family regulatory protein